MCDQKYSDASRFTTFYDNQGHLLAVGPIWQASDYQQPTTPLTHSGAVINPWQNDGPFDGSLVDSVGGDFTPPAGSFQIGTEVALDKGHLTFSGVTLAAYSDPIAVTAGQEYEIAAQVSGSVQAGQGQGGQMVLLYGSTPHTFWQNPANFNGAAQAAYAFTAEPGINTVRLKLVVNLDAGYLAFSNVVLGQQLTPATTAYRSLYSVAGQNIGQRLKEESSTPQLVDTFSDGVADGWTAVAGTWSIQNTGLGYVY
ncbi:MAG: hypothetical protein KF770_29725 [Anaerolineae bacterium]|nr:hypothetical protein [Anaerolineae bacterium]